MEVSEIFNVLGEINYNLKFLTNLVTFDSQKYSYETNFFYK